ncbi:MAG: hypothetical protein U0271_00990 [Polyangiaceae bacterium]
MTSKQLQRLGWMVAGLALHVAACNSKVDNADGGSNDGGSGGSPNIGGAGGDAQGGTAGSGGAPITCDPPANPADFAIGTGEVCFETLTAGQTVPLMEGPQGGYHVWLAVGCSDCGASVAIFYGAKDPTTGALLKDTYESQATINLKGAWPEAAGLFVPMPGISWDPDNYPPPALGTHLILYAERRDANGNVLASDDVEIVIGETQYWDPCSGNPNDPNCQTG